MTVYFTASIAGKKNYISDYLKIIDWLNAHNHRVISDHIVNAKESEINREGREKRLRFHRRLHEWITSCDFVVVEATYPSVSVGYEIALAISCKKPVLVLYNQGDAPSLLSEGNEDRLICVKYNSDTLAGILADFIKFVNGTDDVRFNFFVTASIASYLEQVARTQKLPKSVYLRRLIEADMKKALHNPLHCIII